MNDYCKGKTRGEYSYYNSLEPYQCRASAVLNFGTWIVGGDTNKNFETCYACCNTETPKSVLPKKMRRQVFNRVFWGMF